MPTVLETTLVRTPNVCGGRLRIDGTRLTVNQVVSLYRQGRSAEQIAESYPQRSVSEIYAVLAWYHQNRDSFDIVLAAEAAEDEQAAVEIQAQQRQ